jgi:hypothetical protein
MFANRSLAISLAAAVLAGCGGGGSDAKVVSEGLVASGPSGYVIQAEVDTGPDAHDPGGVCLAFVAFHLFDGAGNEFPVQDELGFLQPDEHLNLRERICRGQVQPLGLADQNLADDASTQSLFLVPNADACPAGTTAPGVLGIDVQLARPLQEVSCETIRRVETEVVGCN